MFFREGVHGGSSWREFMNVFYGGSSWREFMEGVYGGSTLHKLHVSSIQRGRQKLYSTTGVASKACTAKSLIAS